MHITDPTLTMLAWLPFVACFVVALMRRPSWSTSAKVAHSAAWVCLGWLLMLGYVELAQTAAEAGATSEEARLELYARDGAPRAFVALLGWIPPLAGLLAGFALRAVSNRLARLARSGRRG